MLCDVARDCREDVVPNRSALGYPTADVVPAYLQLRDVDHTYLVPDVGKTSLHLLPVHCRTGRALHQVVAPAPPTLASGNARAMAHTAPPSPPLRLIQKRRLPAQSSVSTLSIWSSGAGSWSTSGKSHSTDTSRGRTASGCVVRGKL